MKASGSRRAVLAALATLILVGTATTSAIYAQPGGGGGGRGQFGGRGGGFFGGGGGGATESLLLNSPQVQEALEIVPSQMKEIEELNAGMQEKLQSAFRDAQGGGEGDREARFDKIRDKMTEVANQYRSDLDKVLLPHQSKRLKQIAFQQEIRGRGNVPNTDRIGDALKLSEQQKEKLKAKAEEMEKKLREQIAKIRKDAEDELLTVLTADQQNQFKELSGEPFELQGGMAGAFGFGGQGGGQGGFGGFGGQGGQGGRRGGGNRGGN